MVPTTSDPCLWGLITEEVGVVAAAITLTACPHRGRFSQYAAMRCPVRHTPAIPTTAAAAAAAMAVASTAVRIIAVVVVVVEAIIVAKGEPVVADRIWAI